MSYLCVAVCYILYLSRGVSYLCLTVCHVLSRRMSYTSSFAECKRPVSVGDIAQQEMPSNATLSRACEYKDVCQSYVKQLNIPGTQ